MKPTAGISTKGKHQRPHMDAKHPKPKKSHKHATHHKHEAQDWDLNGASPAFEQIRRALGGLPTSDALLPPPRWPEQRSHVVAASPSGVGKLRTTLLNVGRDVACVPPSLRRTGLTDNPLIRPVPRLHPDDSAHPFGSRSSAAGQGFGTGLGNEAWQINVRSITGLSALVNTCRVSVRDWYTQRFLTSVDLGPYGQDSAVACLARLSKQKGMPHALVIDYQPDLLAQVEQWAFSHGVMVIILPVAQIMG